MGQKIEMSMIYLPEMQCQLCSWHCAVSGYQIANYSQIAGQQNFYYVYSQYALGRVKFAYNS